MCSSETQTSLFESMFIPTWAKRNTDLISDFPGVEAAGSSGGHEFLSRVMGCKSFFSGFVKFGQLFFKGREEGLSQSGVRAGFIAVKQGEWGCLSGAMRGRVVVEFCQGKELYPFSRVVGAKDVEISFKLLIGSLGLSIGLRMVGSGEANIILEEMSKFLSEGRSEGLGRR